MDNTVMAWFRLGVCLSVAVVSAYAAAEGRMPALHNALIINEDDSHFFSSRQADAMNREGLDAFIDQYAGTAVTHLFLCPNAMRASFRSRTRDAIWDPVEGRAPSNRWVDNARLLHERGLDPYTVWIARCREKGISPWLSMRMNDIHSVDDPNSFMHSSFWREHPEWWRVPNGPASPWQNRAMNYAHAAVRAHQMAFVEELLERYDPDGLELDWMRFGWHLTPGRERDEGKYLTEFVRGARALVTTWAGRRGHPILLGVRVPAHPDAAALLGMDGVQWARDGLVDVLVPCPFWSSSDFDIPVELWKERLGPAAGSVGVAPGLEYNARPWPGGKAVANTLGSAYGFAASSLARGADALYLFNWMDSETIPVSAESYRRLVEGGLGSDLVGRVERRHPVCYRDTVPEGFPNGVMLPGEGSEGRELRIHIGPVPASGRVELIVGLARREGVSGATFQAGINGVDAALAGDLQDTADIGGDPARVICFTCPRTAVRDGYNTVRVQQTPGQPPQTIVWVELRIDPTAGGIL
ncbi:MAG TPA: hypothetical protein PKH24_20305 [Sedimentisphaerales bacterium]|jgi:hypothetical protein|nr:hypothetical protein [Sedimentisphaerales bacterium]HNU31358.1 hypothetical protein [Sedimentisphaerales bacterium]